MFRFHQKSFIPCLASLMLALCLAGATLAQDEPRAPLLEGLGEHHHPITTDDELAQRYFDQGLVLAYGFNHGEAERSFLKATKLDPQCAMCFWGAAWVLGPNINAPMDPADAPEAHARTQKALELADKASEREQAYIHALTYRYAPEPPADRSKLDRAFAEAMDRVSERFPEDLDAAVLAAEAWMDTTPWDYWQPDGEPKPVTRHILATLEGVLKDAPEHPMANHLYIHAVEAVHPELGLPSAKRLQDLVPGAGHLVHMPSHIYIRVGRYHDGSLANQRAIEADKAYLKQVEAQGAYPLAYVPHNYHFLWATATLEGRSELALRTAREMAELVDQDAMRQSGLTTLQHYWITPVYALARFGRWDEILAFSEPAEDLVYPRAVVHYARGLALVRSGRLAEAEQELKALEALSGDPSLEDVTVWDINKSRDLLHIAREVLRAELAAAGGEIEKAVEHFKRAIAMEDALNYDEPPTWYAPVRQMLGALLLKAGRPEEAEPVYRADLKVFPDNGWSLFGVLESLRRQGRAAEAEQVQRRFRDAWMHADVTLTASRF